MEELQKSLNPRAFATPAVCSGELTAYEPQEGMTLLDHFAGLAMQGMIANSIDCQQGSQPTWQLTDEQRAEYSYLQAAAMLKERQKHL